MQILGAGFVAFEATKSIYSLAFMFIAYSLPQLLGSYFVEPVLRRFGAKKVAAFSDFIRGILLIALALAVLVDYKVLLLTYLLTFTASTLDAFYQPASNILFQQILAGNLEISRKKSSQLELLTQIAMLLSVTGGALLVDLTGIYFVFFLNAATFLVAGVMIWIIHIIPQYSKDEEVRAPLALYRSTLISHTDLVLNFSLGKIIPSVVNTLIIYFIIGHLAASFSTLGLIDAVAILGIGIGVWSVRFVDEKRNQQAMKICMYTSATFLAFAGYAGLEILIATFFVSTIFFGLSRVLARVNIIEHISDNEAAAVYSTANVVGIFISILLTFFTCIVADFFGIAFGFFTLAAFFAAATLFIIMRQKKSQRENLKTGELRYEQLYKTNNTRRPNK
ncbi:MAG: MFS transporter [Rhizobiales bacterium]|nr:MFS transporter [Hyphomicrobiales bacterium]